MYSPSAFFQVTSVIKTQLESAGKQEHVKIIEKAAGMITFDKKILTHNIQKNLV